MGNIKSNQLGIGTSLGDLIRAMPPSLRQLLNEEVAELDRTRMATHQPGEPKVITMANHLRWIVQSQPDLGLMKLHLFDVLTNYLPITVTQLVSNQLPNLSTCSHFWGIRISELERGSTQTAVPA